MIATPTPGGTRAMMPLFLARCAGATRRLSAEAAGPSPAKRHGAAMLGSYCARAASVRRIGDAILVAAGRDRRQRDLPTDQQIGGQTGDTAGAPSKSARLLV